MLVFTCTTRRASRRLTLHARSILSDEGTRVCVDVRAALLKGHAVREGFAAAANVRVGIFGPGVPRAAKCRTKPAHNQNALTAPIRNATMKPSGARETQAPLKHIHNQAFALCSNKQNGRYPRGMNLRRLAEGLRCLAYLTCV